MSKIGKIIKCKQNQQNRNKTNILLSKIFIVPVDMICIQGDIVELVDRFLENALDVAYKSDSTDVIVRLKQGILTIQKSGHNINQ